LNGSHGPDRAVTSDRARPAAGGPQTRSPRDSGTQAGGRAGDGLPGEAAGGPSASIELLRQRAAILHLIREFFRQRGVLEVETPLLCAAGAVEEHLDPVPARLRLPGAGPRGRAFELVTSPEHSMKRLLAAGSGPIYQITRAFRDGERGRLHNPEFTILEWYRPGFDHHTLMEEVEDLVATVLDSGARQHARAPDTPGGAVAGPVPRPFDRLAYGETFRRCAGIDPHRATIEELRRVAGLSDEERGDRDALLDQILATRVQPLLGVVRPAFLLDYPASAACSARLRAGDPPVAERFELYVRGLEICNGYHELLDPAEQERRYASANRRRRAAGRRALRIDRRLVSALRKGMPPGAGVALGVDRLVMAALCLSSIDEAMAFPVELA
jgi:lysyl-tRNA synthetase class 2